MAFPVVGEGYRLQLANGQAWCLSGVGEGADWAQRLADIMGLGASQPCDARGIIFLFGIPEKRSVRGTLQALPPEIREGLSDVGWQARDLGPFCSWTHTDSQDVICQVEAWTEGDPALQVKLWASVNPIYQAAAETGGLPVHGALVERQGVGAILAAPGGIGKTTCCGRLPAPWRALGDDETLVVQDDRGRYHAHPFPSWSVCARPGSTATWEVGEHVPLGAIFFLDRGPTERAIALAPPRASLLLNSLSAHPLGPRNWIRLPDGEREAAKQRLFGNVCSLARTVPCYILRFTRRGPFWEEIEKVLLAEGLPARGDNHPSANPRP